MICAEAACAPVIQYRLRPRPPPPAMRHHAAGWLDATVAPVPSVWRDLGAAAREWMAVHRPWTPTFVRSHRPSSRALDVDRAPHATPGRPGHLPTRCLERARCLCRARQVKQQASRTDCCRAGALLVRCSRHLVLLNALCREQQSLANVFGFEAGVQLQDLRRAQAVRDHPHGGCHREPHTSDARHPAHLVGADCDSGKHHLCRLAQRRPISGRGRMPPDTPVLYAGPVETVPPCPPLYFPMPIMYRHFGRSDGPIEDGLGGVLAWSTQSYPSARPYTQSRSSDRAWRFAFRLRSRCERSTGLRTFAVCACARVHLRVE
jgi:hypothetical protein